MAAAAFVAFARGSTKPVPWSDKVRYSFNAGALSTLGPRELADPSAWEFCLPGSSTVEGRDCPVSVLGTIARESKSWRSLPLQAAVPETVGCNNVDLPKIDGAVETVTIRQQPSQRDCFGDFAAILLLDRRGRIAAVDFVLSGP